MTTSPLAKFTFALVFGLFASISFSPTAQAFKCPNGQYGLTVCKKCPSNTYSNRKLLTVLGCKKCPKGTHSRPGSTSCTDKPCIIRFGGRAARLPSGSAICDTKNGDKVVCYRGKAKRKGKCAPKRCKASGKNLPHNYSFCQKKDLRTYKCRYGIWVRGNTCPPQACTAKDANGRKKTFKHGSKVCQKGKQYQCKHSHWFEAGKCTTCSAKVMGTTKTFKNGQLVCQKKVQYKCSTGQWKKTGKTCR